MAFDSNGSKDPDGTIASYAWDFGDGNNGTGAKTTHTYAAAGSFDAKLTVKDDKGASATGTLKITIEPIKNPGSLVIATVGEIDTLDPAIDYETAGVDIIQNTYETLVFYDGENADKFVPFLAESMPTISPDGMTYTIKMRAGVKFTSGNAMTATDAAYSLRRAVTIGDQTGPSWMLEQVTTAYVAQYVGQNVSNWKADADGWGHLPSARLIAAMNQPDGHAITDSDVWNVSGEAFMAPDATTLKIMLEFPYPALTSILAFSVASVIDSVLVQSKCGTPAVASRCSFLNSSVQAATGPFMVKDGGWQYGVQLTLTKNPNWWQLGAPMNKKLQLDTVVFKRVDEIATRAQLLRNGDVDMATIGYKDQAQIQDANDKTKWASGVTVDKDRGTFTINMLGLNQNIQNVTGSIPANFFADLNIRMAFAYIWNYKAFLDNCMFGGGEQAPGPIPKGMFGYKDVGALKPTFDKAKAEEFFKKTKYWDSGFYIEVQWNAGNTARECAMQLLKKELEALNSKFHVNASSYDWPVYLDKLRKKQLSAFFLGWAPDYADPDDYAQPFMRSTGIYPSRVSYKNPVVDQLVDDAAKELDPVKRAAMYGQIQEWGFKDMPYVWTLQSWNFHTERTWIQGWYYNAMLAGGGYYAAMYKGA